MPKKKISSQVTTTVEFRKMYLDVDKKLKEGGGKISLNLDQWQRVKDNVKKTDKKLQRLIAERNAR